MPNVKFTVPSPYSQQAAELDRRQRMAELMQQQAIEPIQTQSAGGIVLPVSPVAGLSKLLRSYMSSRQLSDVASKRAALEQQDIAAARQMAEEFGRRSVDQPIAEGDDTLRELAVRPVASSVPGKEYRTQLVEPALTQTERQANILPAALGAGVGPYQQKLAEMLYTQKPEAPKGSFAPINMKDVDVTQSDIAKYRETGNPAYLVMKEQPEITEYQRRRLEQLERAANKPDGSRVGIPSPDRFTLESLEKYQRTGKFTDLVERPSNDQIYRREDALRANFENRAKPYIAEIDATSKILDIANSIPPGQKPDAITQQSFVILLNKFLDPGSVVREAEFNRVLEAQGVFRRAAMLKDRLVKGEILDQESLNQITNLAKLYQDVATTKIKQAASEIADVAKRRTLNVESVILNPTYLEPAISLESQSSSRSNW